MFAYNTYIFNTFQHNMCFLFWIHFCMRSISAAVGSCGSCLGSLDHPIVLMEHLG